MSFCHLVDGFVVAFGVGFSVPFNGDRQEASLVKWIWDLQRVVDYLLTRPDVDPANIGIIGHSLGGKMALYGAAFEPRIKAIVSSEPGISLKFSNYQDFWYLGKTIENLPAGADQHELIAQMSPRPFLLITTKRRTRTFTVVTHLCFRILHAACELRQSANRWRLGGPGPRRGRFC